MKTITALATMGIALTITSGALAQNGPHIITSGPGQGTIINASNGSVVNGQLGHSGTIIGPEMGCPDFHYHGLLFNNPDPNPMGCGWGTVAPYVMLSNMYFNNVVDQINTTRDGNIPGNDPLKILNELGMKDHTRLPIDDTDPVDLFLAALGMFDSESDMEDFYDMGSKAFAIFYSEVNPSGPDPAPKPSTPASTPVIADANTLNDLIDNGGMTKEGKDKALKLLELFTSPDPSQAPLSSLTQQAANDATPVVNGTSSAPPPVVTAAPSLWAGGGTGTKEDPFVITPAEWDAELKGFEEILDTLIDESWTGMYNPLVPWRRLDSKFMTFQDFHYTVSPWNRTMGGGDINYFLQGMYWRKLGLDWPAVEAIIRVWKIQYDSVALDNVLFAARAGFDYMAQTPGTDMTYGQTYDAAKIIGGILIGHTMDTFFGED